MASWAVGAHGGGRRRSRRGVLEASRLLSLGHVLLSGLSGVMPGGCARHTLGAQQVCAKKLTKLTRGVGLKEQAP